MFQMSLRMRLDGEPIQSEASGLQDSDPVRPEKGKPIAKSGRKVTDLT